MASLVIIKTGDAFPEVVDQHGDFEQLFIRRLNDTLPEQLTLKVWDARLTATPPDDIAGAVITGSHSMVSEQPSWSEALKPWLQQALADNLPLLGVCYGHQLMAAAFGGISDYHPAGRESGTRTVRLTQAGQQDPLFSQLPVHFPAHLTHAQSVMQLPHGATILAHNCHDAHQALRYGPRQWSVQFHPEFSPPVMRAYIERQRAALRDQGDNPDQLLNEISETPEATSLLQLFIDFI
ncbi:glutamine amidotransferase [Halomonas aquamarina]|mgnify:FL=1|jgi:GMP synthase (glutamine-hydrolysing)|uniref:Glutamine amidotransferase domain-containing protein n=1 Tax=Vreelandella aquamarina TaxID=77097 RepID=A0A6F8SS46_9GAMM|nr:MULTISPECIES: glutamine amidotransferase [Halomonas]KTG30189.1 glutamine amidotransferase [Idiomarina sp. H105]MEC7294929.1 glutamine amidotransferase [Pseudomonadota bacterium]OAF14715.1 glutamine amidotransferase [Idiomarina sp. WRN-38]HBN59760.1 glutamine amidotransferase [Halomonas sp.]MCC4292014.1 glutamine amidotransferase [Halomonas axialensis]|tara:strand:+ start:2998 stop:3708 length:711 start_codon:yes stop_codon:yes gene_type:complete